MWKSNRQLTISWRRLKKRQLPNVCGYANFDNRYGYLSLSYWAYWITFLFVEFVKKFLMRCATLNLFNFTSLHSFDHCIFNCNSCPRLNNLCWCQLHFQPFLIITFLDTYQADFSSIHKSMATWTMNENLLSLHMAYLTAFSLLLFHYCLVVLSQLRRWRNIRTEWHSRW